MCRARLSLSLSRQLSACREPTVLNRTEQNTTELCACLGVRGRWSPTLDIEQPLHGDAAQFAVPQFTADLLNLPVNAEPGHAATGRAGDTTHTKRQRTRTQNAHARKTLAHVNARARKTHAHVKPHRTNSTRSTPGWYLLCADTDSGGGGGGGGGGGVGGGGEVGNDRNYRHSPSPPTLHGPRRAPPHTERTGAAAGSARRRRRRRRSDRQPCVAPGTGLLSGYSAATASRGEPGARRRETAGYRIGRRIDRVGNLVPGQLQIGFPSRAGGGSPADGAGKSGDIYALRSSIAESPCHAVFISACWVQPVQQKRPVQQTATVITDTCTAQQIQQLYSLRF